MEKHCSPAASFPFQLAVDTLLFGLHFPLAECALDSNQLISAPPGRTRSLELRLLFTKGRGR